MPLANRQVSASFLSKASPKPISVSILFSRAGSSMDETKSKSFFNVNDDRVDLAKSPCDHAAACRIRECDLARIALSFSQLLARLLLLLLRSLLSSSASSGGGKAVLVGAVSYERARAEGDIYLPRTITRYLIAISRDNGAVDVPPDELSRLAFPSPTKTHGGGISPIARLFPALTPSTPGQL